MSFHVIFFYYMLNKAQSSNQNHDYPFSNIFQSLNHESKNVDFVELLKIRVSRNLVGISI